MSIHDTILSAENARNSTALVAERPLAGALAAFASLTAARTSTASRAGRLLRAGGLRINGIDDRRRGNFRLRPRSRDLKARLGSWLRGGDDLRVVDGSLRLLNR